MSTQAELRTAPAPRLVKPEPRFVNPNAPAETQYAQLMEFIKNPPENSRVIVITPGLAALILKNLNSRNRKLRPTKIKRMGADMGASNWKLTGVPLIFSRGNILLDGQNRLTACVRSGVPFKTHVVFGIADEAFVVIDTGAGRTNPDAMKIDGVPYPEVHAQAVRWLMIRNIDPLQRGLSFTNEEVLDYYRTGVDEESMGRAVKRAIAVHKPLPTGSLAAHLYLFEKSNAKAAARFAQDLADRRGGGLKLINKLTALRKQGMGRLHETQSNALIIQAWNAYRAGNAVSMSMLNWNENKEYPTIG